MENPLEVDASLVVRTFAERESVLFSDFSDVWSGLSCPLLFWHGYNLADKFEAVEHLMRFSIQYALNEKCGWYIRLGGLYLAYAFYFTQPFQPKSTIRLVLSEYDVLKKYHREMKEHKLIQADYILSTLNVHSAFSMCYSPLPMCLAKQKQGLYSDDTLQKMQPNLENVVKEMKVAMKTKVEEYADLKQSLSAYLPQHLLTTSPLLQELDKALTHFAETKEKLKKVQTSSESEAMEEQNSD